MYKYRCYRPTIKPINTTFASCRHVNHIPTTYADISTSNCANLIPSANVIQGIPLFAIEMASRICQAKNDCHASTNIYANMSLRTYRSKVL